MMMPNTMKLLKLVKARNLIYFHHRPINCIRGNVERLLISSKGLKAIIKIIKQLKCYFEFMYIIINNIIICNLLIIIIILLLF